MASTLRMPLTISPGAGLTAVPQGSNADLGQSVALLLQTLPGERRAVPDYGLPNPLGGQPVGPADLTAAVLEWEERADPTIIQRVVARTASAVDQVRAYPRTEQVGDAAEATQPLIIGDRYTVGLGIDPDTGQVFIDPSQPEQTGLALKTGAAHQPYAESDPEPRALVVGVDGPFPYFQDDGL